VRPEKLEQIGSLETRCAALGDVLFTQNLRLYIRHIEFLKDQFLSWTI
jgi:hypothetical protein